jgi:hypothetical protein
MDRGPIFRPDSSLREIGPPTSPCDAGPAPAVWDSTHAGQGDPSLEEVIRRARRAAGIGDHPPLPALMRNNSFADVTFRRLWVAGTFAPLLTGIITYLVGGARPLVVLLLVVGMCTLLVNIGLAGQTKGYSEGRLKALGQRVVCVTAWIGLALMALVVVTGVYALVIAVGVLLLLGVAAGRDSVGSRR